MFGFLLFTASTICAFIYVFICPIISWIVDLKGLRKYPTLHPLSGFTNLALVYEAQKGDRHHSLLLRHKDNPVIRLGPNFLSFSAPAAIKDIYGHSTPCIKDQFYTELAGSHRHLADVVDKAEHARKRKVLSSAFAIRHLEEWEYKVTDMTSRLIKAYDQACTAPVVPGNVFEAQHGTIDHRDWMNYFTIAAIANIGLSEDVGFLDRGDDMIISEGVDGTTKKVSYRESLFGNLSATTYLVWVYDWYTLFASFCRIISPTYRKNFELAANWDGIVLRRATSRLKRYQAGEKGDDFFTALMEDRMGRPHNLEFGEIVAEISIMMNAGSDTTGIALSNIMCLLVNNPRCLTKLREELDEALGDDTVVARYATVKNLPYLRACIDESLRLLPPITFNLPRLTPPEGMYIAGEWVPGNTSVGISAYVMHRQESLYENAEEYRPERWLGEAGKELQKYFIPFSTGARGCIGRNISYLEQTVMVATLFHRYDFALPCPGFDPGRIETTTCSPGSIPIKVWRRK
ncbi:Cytochrome P450-like protein 4 [Elsinoe fawcettii]|nr:Cytochrome P450-like protein 4 [Elsinoe fawcettii]